MLKTHQQHSADAGPSWVFLACLPGSSPKSKANLHSSSAWPPVLSSLFLTHGFPVPPPSLHRPRESLFVFGLVILQPPPLICPFVSFAARCWDQGSSLLSLPYRTGTCKIAQKPPLVSFGRGALFPSVCAPHLCSYWFLFLPTPAGLTVSHCHSPPPQFQCNWTSKYPVEQGRTSTSVQRAGHWTCGSCTRGPVRGCRVGSCNLTCHMQSRLRHVHLQPLHDTALSNACSSVPRRVMARRWAGWVPNLAVLLCFVLCDAC
ncbi:hypothetical protein V8C34DRAFT_72559 [Trichoderma compactum]